MVEIHMPEADSSSSSSSSSSSDSEYSEEPPVPVVVTEFKQQVVAIEVESPRTPPPIFIHKQGPAMVSCDTAMVSVMIVKKVPKPPKTMYHGILYIQLYWKWYTAWRDFKVRMMRENKQIVNKAAVRIKNQTCGPRWYNIKLFKIFK